MGDFVPLLNLAARPGFSAGMPGERVEVPGEPDAESAADRAQQVAEVVTPIRGIAGVRSVELPDHSAARPRPAFLQVPEEDEEEPEEEAPPPGPTEEEVAQMIAEAEQRVRQQAEAEMAEIRAEVDTAKEALGQAVEAVEAHQAQLSSQARDQAGALVVQAVERICGELPEALAGILRDRCAAAAESLVGSGEVVLRIRPADIALAADLVGDRDGWRLEPDASLKGGCIAESSSGSVDGSLEAALAGIRAAAAAWRQELGDGGGGR